MFVIANIILYFIHNIVIYKNLLCTNFLKWFICTCVQCIGYGSGILYFSYILQYFILPPDYNYIIYLSIFGLCWCLLLNKYIMKYLETTHNMLNILYGGFFIKMYLVLIVNFFYFVFYT